jgi:transposase InsO family protein
MVYTLGIWGGPQMPWKECRPMDERLRFIARLLEGEKMAPLCREFGISRVTGYKIFNRYKECGLDALNDRSRRPYRQANKLPFQIERSILGIKREHPSWGAPKIRDKLIRQYPMVKPPAISTVHAVLDRNGLVKRRKRRRHKAEGTTLVAAHAPNGLWCADYKGEFMLGNKQYCYPLTITDYRSRYLLACEGLKSTRSELAFSVFEEAFKEYGLPNAIRTDNGGPFASANALFGLSRLSVWWLRLSIQLQRIKPGNPQQNGRHERMHLTLKKEATKPASFNFLQQQERFDRFVKVYNNERPHQALGGAYPGEVYTPSARVYEPPPPPDYPFHDRTVSVTRCGRICFAKRKINLSTAFAGQTVGIREVADQIWVVSFMHYDLGFFDNEKGRVEPARNPFTPDNVLTMSPE